MIQRKLISIVLLFLVYANVTIAQQNTDSLVSQTITYHTSKAGEMYIGWSLNNWKDIPDKSSKAPIQILIIILHALISAVSFVGTTTPKSLFTQTIIYNTSSSPKYYYYGLRGNYHLKYENYLLVCCQRYYICMLFAQR